MVLRGRATKKARTKRVWSTRAMKEPSPKMEGDSSPPLVARVHNNQLLRRQPQQGWKMAKAAKATAPGATLMVMMTTMATLATMMPNGNKDNENGNSKSNDKTMTMATTTSEGGQRRQSCRDNRGGAHHCPRDTAITLTAAPQHTCVDHRVVTHYDTL